ncbi:integrase catalytic domain-containing protein, partial [Trichonephila inaurata madagascariensis]
MNKLKNELDSQSVDTLHEHFDYLNENLRELDKKIQNIIEVEEEFDAEIQSASGYKEKISMLCSKIQIQIKNLSKNDPSVSSQTTLNVQNDSLNNSTNGSSVNYNRNVNSVLQLENLVLADSPDCQKPITILIGADYYYDVVTVCGKIKHLKKKLVAVETIFGWCLQGRNNENQSSLAVSVIVQENLISDQLKKFWDLEVSGLIDSKNESDVSENQIMKNFESNIKYDEKANAESSIPLDFGTFTLRIKHLMQKVWLLSVEWDESLPEDIISLWAD